MRATLHGFAAAPRTALGRWLRVGPQLHGSFAGAISPFGSVVARVSGPDKLLDEAAQGLPEGPARAEAIAVRLRRQGVSLRWGDPVSLPTTASLLELMRYRGASSLEMLRADPSLLSELQVGSWFDAAWRARLLRRIATTGSRRRAERLTAGAARAVGHVRLQRPLLLRTLSDAAFWSGVRSAATPAEWRRLTASSYVVLCYHRIAGEQKPGQENLDVHPRRFRRQMHLLRLLRFRPLAPRELVAFHHDPCTTLPRRSYVVTADDGYRDCAVALRGQSRHRPQLFVPTAAVGRRAWWADYEPVASWPELAELTRRQIAVGPHTRTHRVLPELGEEALEEELAGSFADLRSRLRPPTPMLAYPHGRYDLEVRAAAMRAGYQIAYTTAVGRNGAGTDPYCLRRIGVKERDGMGRFLWKVLTGQLAP